MNALPKWVTNYNDRHGKPRYRFRRGGVSRQLPHPLSDHFEAVYAQCLKETPPTPIRSPRSAVGRFRALMARHGWSEKGEFIYFVATNGAVKIGFSSMILMRLTQLTAQSPTRIRLLAAAPGGRAVEKSLHERFAADRLKGEWFRLSPQIRAIANEVKRSGTFANKG